MDPNPSVNAYGKQTGMIPMLPPVTPQATTTLLNESLLLPLYYSSMAPEATLTPVHQQQQQAKATVAAATSTAAFNDDDSVLTYHNTNFAFPPSRKRSRDSTIVGGSSYSTAPPLSLPASTQKTGDHHPTTVAAGSSSFSFLGQDLSLQFMQQQWEIDRLISYHMEKVRLEIEERRAVQSKRIVSAIEAAVSKRLRDRDDEIVKIGKVNYALEERVKTLCVENQIWRELAQTNEATANALQAKLEQLLSHSDPVVGAEEDDAESCCGSSDRGKTTNDDDEQEAAAEGSQMRWREVGDGRNRLSDGRTGIAKNGGNDGQGGESYSGNFVMTKGRRMCRRCGREESSVLLLPCRHLCLCIGCGPTVDACPMCNSAKTASVHVNLS
ncbi:hypothetical protein Dimus_011189 [Dionaea muscipula]